MFEISVTMFFYLYIIEIVIFYAIFYFIFNVTIKDIDIFIRIDFSRKLRHRI